MADFGILVTGVGAPGTAGTIAALKHNPDGWAGRVGGVDMKYDVAGRFLVDDFATVPSPEDPSYESRLLALCRGWGIRVVIPQTTREVAALSSVQPAFASEGISVVTSPKDAVEAANDKHRVLQVFRNLGLPHPRFRLTNSRVEIERAATELGYPDKPVVAKPTVSSGMRGLRIVTEAMWTLDRYLQEKPSSIEISLPGLLAILKTGVSWPSMLVTEYLPGDEYSVDAFVGTHARVAVPRIRNQIRSGISFVSMLRERPDLCDYTLRAGEALGLRYAFGFQYKEDDHGVPRVLECNPRVQGTMVASLTAGVNLIWSSVREAIGQPITDLRPVIDPDSGIFRFWGGVLVREGGSVGVV